MIYWQKFNIFKWKTYFSFAFLSRNSDITQPKLPQKIKSIVFKFIVQWVKICSSETLWVVRPKHSRFLEQNRSNALAMLLKLCLHQCCLMLPNDFSLAMEESHLIWLGIQVQPIFGYYLKPVYYSSWSWVNAHFSSYSLCFSSDDSLH